MAFFGSLMSEEHLQCSVCLDVFTNPVSIPCGHSFCKACICRHWEGNESQQCPLCKKIFGDPVDLNVNIVLAEIAKELKRRKRKRAADPEDVACDTCSGERLKAVRTCLRCCTSYCNEHVIAHRAQFEDHELASPLQNPQGQLCQVHGEPLEKFCQDDKVCVCSLCTEADHVSHCVVPAESEWMEKKAQLRREILQVKQKVLDRLTKVEEIKEQVKLGRNKAKKEIEDGIQVFTSLTHLEGQLKAQLVEEIEQKQKREERRAGELIEELEQETAELKEKNIQLRTLSNSKDRVHFLQNFSTVCSPSSTKDWSNVSVHAVMSVHHMRVLISQLKDYISKEEVKLDDVEFNKVQQYAVNVTLDPMTAHWYLKIYEGGTQVKYEPLSYNRDNPKRFNNWCAVLGRDGILSGRHYWEVQVKNVFWVLGVARESTNRKKYIDLKPSDGLWTIGYEDKKGLKAFNDPLVSLTTTVKKVGVYVDYEEGVISFYNADTKSHLYTFSENIFSEKLYPVFSPTKNGDDTNPLIICPVVKPNVCV